MVFTYRLTCAMGLYQVEIIFIHLVQWQRMRESKSGIKGWGRYIPQSVWGLVPPSQPGKWLLCGLSRESFCMLWQQTGHLGRGCDQWVEITLDAPGETHMKLLLKRQHAFPGNLNYSPIYISLLLCNSLSSQKFHIRMTFNSILHWK